MRQLATLPHADARALADYLLTLKIDSQLEQQPDGWAVWIRDEDHLPRARQELEEFQRNPADPRYQAAAGTAGTLRKQKRREETAFHRRQERFYARMGRAGSAGGVTLALIAISVVAFVLKDGFSFGRSVEQALLFSPYYRYERIEIDPSTRELTLKLELRSAGLEPIRHGQIWRLVTPIFIHYGIMHLLLNMWWLYLLGGAIEGRRGRIRYLLLVLAVAVVSNTAQYFLGNLASGEPLASLPRSVRFGGMSGVVYGLLGYVWMKARFQPEMGLSIDSTNLTLMIVFLFLCMTPLIHIFIAGNVANAAHVAGLLMGMFLGYAPILWQSLRSD
jgi:GlpG protein